MIFATPTILAALLFGGQALAACFTPEPDQRICYNSAGATTQNVTLKEVQYTAKYLRYYGGLASSPPFFSMPAVDGDACPEWQVTSKGSTLVLAKFVGEKNGSVTFNDIANTIDGGAAETTDQIASALMGCGTAGGQMGVKVNATDPLYQANTFVSSGATNKGFVIKVVRNPDVK